ncbi:MAG: IS256 family transposase [Ardenticatenales bacterium]|nr:IS256 family transposase [Ardenticatenales bacterium]
MSEKTRRESVAQARAARLAEAVVEATAGRPGVSMPSAERVMAELATAKSVNDFYGKDGIFARLFAKTIEEMLEGEITAHLGYEAHEVVGRNSGNSRNGRYRRTLKTEGGEQTIAVPRDRNGSFEPQIIGPYQRQTNEIEEKILALYARGQSVRDIQDVLEELYGIDVAPATISAVTDKIMPLVTAWQTRPLSPVYPIVFLDGLHIKLRRENNRVETVVVYIVFAIDTEGHRDVLGHWVSDGAEGANFWLSVLTDLQSRGVEDILIASIDGLVGFDEAIRAIFPKVCLQRCVIHQIRASLRYVTWKDYKAFIADLKTVYRAQLGTKQSANSYARRGLGQALSRSRALLAHPLGRPGHLLRLPGRDPQTHLHDQPHRGVQSPTAKGDQDQRLLPDRRCRQEAPLPGPREHLQTLDWSHPRLASRPQSARHPLR